ncbi:hypothetical protein SAMN05216226_107163 [Halovenus aranensis]|uniref:Gluconate 2-dehydrogenase subunit 3 n=1 Tax=Halovenus aranensis TaxID=890420 RepID=A0A1G8VTV4_9EURY|nr:hypothetical protein [Halovenus aranensis]SDJ69484.1 hypothetical protein SAMN05216226_107163 [Halovenus aranensis]
MELSRRDALAALSALGTTAMAGCAARAPQEGVDESVVETYVAIAAVVYPTAVSGVPSFVRSFLPARLDRSTHGPAMRETVTELQTVSREWYDEEVPALDESARDQLLREVGVDAADEDPEGTLAERVRFYVVNELLLALYSSPTGGDLVGIENPQGHPGGTDTYQRGPSK